MTANSASCGLIIITLRVCSVSPDISVGSLAPDNRTAPGLLNKKMNPAQRGAIMSGEQPH